MLLLSEYSYIYSPGLIAPRLKDKGNIAHLLVSAPLHPVGSTPVESNRGAFLLGMLEKLIKLLPKLSGNGNISRLDFPHVNRKFQKHPK